MIAFHIFGIPVYRYGIMYLIGFSAGYIFFRYIGKKGYTKPRPTVHTLMTKKLDDFMIAIILGGILGSRIATILIYDLPYYRANPDQLLAFRNGGMSFIGGIFGAIIGVYILLVRSKLIQTKPSKKDRASILRIFDHMAVIAPFGIIMGRIGNFLNKELYGLIVYNKALLSTITNDAWFSLKDHILFIRTDIYQRMENRHLIYNYGTSDQFTNELRLNTNFLSAFGEGLTILIILQIIYRTSYRKANNKPGTLAASFLLLYSLVRFLLEYLRQDALSYYRGPFTNSQRFFIIFFLSSLVFFYKTSQKVHHQKDLNTKGDKTTIAKEKK